jgi:methyl-accepting chemotaxis protein
MLSASAAQSLSSEKPPMTQTTHQTDMGELDTALFLLIQLMIEQLPKVASLVENNALDLSQRFRQLADGAATQSQTVQNIVDMASALEVNGEMIPLNEFTNLFSDTLSDSVQKILYVSKMAMSMVYSLDEAIKSLEDIESFVNDIQRINKQANLLALNANIEANHAGERGKGFAIVAREMKSVSKLISNLAVSMREKISLVSGSVNKAHGHLHDVATTDMTNNIMAKEKLDRLIESLILQNTRFTSILQQSAVASRELSQTIGKMVMNMQFQDRTTQSIQNIVGALAFIQKHLQALPNNTWEPESMNSLVNSFTLSEFKQSFMAGLQEKNGVSESEPVAAKARSEEVELF